MCIGGPDDMRCRYAGHAPVRTFPASVACHGLSTTRIFHVTINGHTIVPPCGCGASPTTSTARRFDHDGCVRCSVTVRSIVRRGGCGSVVVVPVCDPRCRWWPRPLRCGREEFPGTRTWCYVVGTNVTTAGCTCNALHGRVPPTTASSRHREGRRKNVASRTAGRRCYGRFVNGNCLFGRTSRC